MGLKTTLIWAKVSDFENSTGIIMILKFMSTIFPSWYDAIKNIKNQDELSAQREIARMSGLLFYTKVRTSPPSEAKIPERGFSYVPTEKAPGELSHLVLITREAGLIDIV
jgi:hypothetical protein